MCANSILGQTDFVGSLILFIISLETACKSWSRVAAHVLVDLLFCSCDLASGGKSTLHVAVHT